MIILAIETSCDETAVALIECDGNIDRASFRILGNALYSQAEKQAEYGGVYPNLAKREHQENLSPLAREALTHAGMFIKADEDQDIPESVFSNIRDDDFKTSIASFLKDAGKPDIDLIAVTRGPGLEPALWTGINFAEALSRAWHVPLVGIDHMEGHIVSALLKPKDKKHLAFFSPNLPLMALLISGGHTELVLMKEWFVYSAIGKTRDDAVGEAFDKVARLLSLSYPGGPRIAELAEKSRARGGSDISFTIPMAEHPTCDFSFSGLKTAVMYKLKTMDHLSESDREAIAEAFENTARDALITKTRMALQKSTVHSLIIAGGVSANKMIRNSFTKLVAEEFPHLDLHVPDPTLSGDNAIMIGAAAYLRKISNRAFEGEMTATGKLTLED